MSFQKIGRNGFDNLFRETEENRYLINFLSFTDGVNTKEMLPTGGYTHITMTTAPVNGQYEPGKYTMGVNTLCITFEYDNLNKKGLELSGIRI